tara:strand:- start:1921 stop:2601 length:681 start_codon:yes stop_codon:yes gene_type:complete
MSGSARLRWKRTLNQLKFLYEELDLIKEMSREGALDFQNYFNDYCRDNGINFRDIVERSMAHQRQQHQESLDEIGEGSAGALMRYESQGEGTEEESEIPYEMSQDEQELFDTFSKLFKRLALVLHPDKLADDLPTNERRVKLKEFKEANDALKHQRYFVLLDLAAKYKIKPPKNYKQQIRWMKKQIGKVSEAAENEKTTYNYMFTECETDAEKEQLIENFVNQLKS